MSSYDTPYRRPLIGVREDPFTFKELLCLSMRVDAFVKHLTGRHLVSTCRWVVKHNGTIYEMVLTLGFDEVLPDTISYQIKEFIDCEGPNSYKSGWFVTKRVYPEAPGTYQQCPYGVLYRCFHNNGLQYEREYETYVRQTYREV